MAIRRYKSRSSAVGRKKSKRMKKSGDSVPEVSLSDPRTSKGSDNWRAEYDQISSHDKQFLEVLFKLMEKGIVSDVANYKKNQAFEKAKRLSANAAFQHAVSELRRKWNINPHLPTRDESIVGLPPKFILERNVFPQRGTAYNEKKLLDQLKRSLCEPFDLDWDHDIGLIVSAVCFDLTPENLRDHWEDIWVVAAKERSPGADLVLRWDDADRRKYIGALMSIAFLAWQLDSKGVQLTSLPAPVRDWVRISMKLLGSGDQIIHPKAAPVIIDQLKGRPDDGAIGDPNVYIHIKPETRKEDLMRTWPQIELQRVQLWGKSPKRTRTWSTYERDVELTRLYDELDNYEEVVREYDRRHPGKHLVPESGSGDPVITDDVLDLVRQAVKRVRDRVTAEHKS